LDAMVIASRMTPRLVVGALGLLLCVVGLAAHAFWLEPSSLRVANVEIRLPSPATPRLRVAVLSDLHVGAPYYGVRRLRDVVDRINSVDADIICFLGDFVTKGVVGGGFVEPEAIAAELGRLHAPLGVMAVLGNHDRSYDGPRVYQALVANGITVLEDTAVSLSPPGGTLWIAGVSDFWTAPHDVGRALSAVSDTVNPVILITHNPDVFPRVPPRVLLTLAGHTHGGQVRLPFIGAPAIPSRYGPRFAAGHIVENGRHLFVSTGIGTSLLPVRFMVPPTIFVLELMPAVKGDGR
jgi:predicted MPP superfamily phosphohydrolase